MEITGMASSLPDQFARPCPDGTEALLTASALNRFEDLCALLRIVELVDGLEGAAGQLATLCRSLEGGALGKAGGPGRDERLRSPVFRGWLADFSHVENWSADDVRLRRQAALLDNMRVGFLDAADWEAELAVIDGICQTWDSRLALGGLAGDTIRIDKRGSRLQLSLEDGTRRNVEIGQPDETRHPGDIPLRWSVNLPGTAIALRNDLPLLQLRMREDEVPTRHRGLEYGERDARASSYGDFAAAEFTAAAGILAQAWPEEFADWRKTLRVVVPRNAPTGWEVHGFTVASHQGACWVVARGLPAVLETLVHEQSHIKLRYIEESFPLLEATQTAESFQVGWRSDPRPIEGIFEGVYVNLHAVEALERAIRMGAMDATDKAIAEHRIDGLRTQVKAATTVLERHARLTSEGDGFLQWALAA